MGLLYRTWFEFTGWAAALVLWLFILQGQVIWWQPAALWAVFVVLWFLTTRLGGDPGALPLAAVLVFCGWVFLTRLDPPWQRAFLWNTLGRSRLLLRLAVPWTRLPRPSLGLGRPALWPPRQSGESAGGAKLG